MFLQLQVIINNYFAFFSERANFRSGAPNERPSRKLRGVAVPDKVERVNRLVEFAGPVPVPAVPAAVG